MYVRALFGVVIGFRTPPTPHLVLLAHSTESGFRAPAHIYLYSPHVEGVLLHPTQSPCARGGPTRWLRRSGAGGFG